MSQDDYGVPEAPQIEKEWRFKTVQKLGVPLLFLIPILALLSVFGPSQEMVTESGAELSLEVSYPTRFRYKTIAPIRIGVTNISSQTAPTVTVKLDRDYLSAFSNLSFQPAVDEITDDAYYVQLNDLEAGETGRVELEMQAETYWRLAGVIEAAAGGVEAPPDARVMLETFVFP